MNEMQSYLAFFGLREQPFAPTADPAYFYATREHKECLFRLWNSIDGRHGIAVILGNYGTGKTTLLRKLITGMAANPERYCTGIIGSPIPSWTSFALLESAVAQFGLQPQEKSYVGYMETLNQFLLRNRDRSCTLIIDDAQNLNKRGQLELLRLVQNLETHQYKLLNLVCFAQLEWMDVLRAAPNFAQRINMTYTLGPVQYDETCHFIEFRLHQAGAQPGSGPEFTETALRAIHAYSEGSPRIIVTLCRNAILLAAQLKTFEIGHDLILHTIDKTTLPDPERRARVVAAIAGMVRGGSETEDIDSLVDKAARDQISRDQRAAQLLLRAVREQPIPTMDTL
ncbi:MAG TPA: AAA family ATPase [Candidatus Hydrogenedentes bacterium]|nr:AAA family ATPase [Candidatus Hydrogenedentota bacterium]